MPTGRHGFMLALLRGVPTIAAYCSEMVSSAAVIRPAVGFSLQ